MEMIYSSFITDNDLKDARDNIIDNLDVVDYDEEYTEKNIEDETIFDEAVFLKEVEYDFLCDDLKQYDLKHPLRLYEIKGTHGSWDGIHNIVPVIETSLFNAIQKCIGKKDDFEILENRGGLIVKSYHHDGVNTFTIKIKDETQNYYKNVNYLKFMREE